jgi:hypothetical protein
MRFSIVYDDNGTIFAASLPGDEVIKAVSGPGENFTEVELPDDVPEAELSEFVERVLLSMDPKMRA